MKFSFNFQATGTVWQVDILFSEGLEKNIDENINLNVGINVDNDIGGDIDLEKLSALIKERVEEFESVYSRFRKDSLITRISKSAGTYIFPKDAQGLFALYRKMYETTVGLVTPLIGQVISDAGYDAEYSLVSKKQIEHVKDWDEVMVFDNQNSILTTSEPVLLDFGAIGKGYLIDIVGEIISGELMKIEGLKQTEGFVQKYGLESYIVNAGGDILHRSHSHKTRVGLEHPHNAKQVIGIAEIFNQSICGSSGNRRAWGEYHHIINPKTKASPRHIAGVWVIVDTLHKNSTAKADALTTALFFTDPETLIERLGPDFKFEYLIVYTDNTMRKSESFPAKMF